MTPDTVIEGLRRLSATFRRYLDSLAPIILQEAIAEVQTSYDRYCHECRQAPRLQRSPTSWGYTVSPKRPLVFSDVENNGLRLQPDLFCTLRWAQADQPPCRENIVLRVWSLDDDVIYRPDWDADDVVRRLDHRRVMLRYHFDAAEPLQDGPEFHVQVGGNARQEEVCWLHEGISVPRLPYPPMDLVLACELVVANFFGDIGKATLTDGLWLRAVRNSQQHTLAGYYQQCSQALGQGNSILRDLWNTTWA